MHRATVRGAIPKVGERIMGKMSWISALVEDQLALENTIATTIRLPELLEAELKWEANYQELRRWFSALEIRKMMMEVEGL